MKTLEDFKVSLYKTNNSVENIVVPLLNILHSIISGEWKDKILAIRRYMEEGDKSGASLLKSELPSFTVTGTFKGGHAIKNLLEATGLVILDFDHPANLEALRSVSNADPHTVACFQSPRDGLKVIVHIEGAAGRHAEAYKKVRAYYEHLTGVEIDESGKDLSRTCLVSYDPRAYIATLYDSFVLPEIPADSRTTDESKPLYSTNSTFTTDSPISHAGQEKEFISSYIFFTPLTKGNRHTRVLKLAYKAAESHCDPFAIYSGLKEIVCDETFSENELKQTLNSAYQQISKKEDATESSSERGNSALVSANLPISHPTNSLRTKTEEEAYLEGEEFRKKTPVFDEEVYNNLPTFLRECLNFHLSPREQDVLLLADLTAFSALMPCTWGKYNGKRYTPHIYTWSIAPSASGKGAADLGGRLLNFTDQQIQRESDIAFKRYEKAKNEWDAARAHNLHGKEKNELPDEPEEPPYKVLIIPSNTSNSRLIMQLRDNAETGGIIFETEVETMTNSNKQDYGHLDTILCKVSGHERISYSYFTHGKRPINCAHPCMAAMFTGTVTQMSGLLPNAESGLFSRFLPYTFRENPNWKNMGEDSEDLEEVYDQLSEKAYRLYLFCRSHPLMFSFTPSQWNKLNTTFRALLEEVYLEDKEGLMANVKRYACTVMRISMLLTRLEMFEKNDSAMTATCPQALFEAAMSIVLCCFEHCRLLYTAFDQPHNLILKDPSVKEFPLKELPATFTRAEAIEAAGRNDISERSADRWIKRAEGLIINKVKRGIYEKILPQSL